MLLWTGAILGCLLAVWALWPVPTFAGRSSAGWEIEFAKDPESVIRAFSNATAQDVPFLARVVCLRPSLSDRFRGLLLRGGQFFRAVLPRAAVSRLPLPSNHQVDLQNCALTALERLGPEALEAVPALAGLLDDTNAFIRYKALRVLSRMGPASAPALPQLTRMVSDADENNCVLALGTLVRMGSSDPAVLDALRGRLKDASAGVRMAAVAGLLEKGEGMAVLLPALTFLADTGGVQQRLEVLRMIGGAGERGVKALGIVAGRFADTDPVVRSAAVSVAGSFGRAASELIPALEQLQGDPDPKVRLRVSIALKQVH